MTDAPKAATVLVIGCKLPNGLICELGKHGDDNYQRVTLNGSNSATIIGGYGITPNVPAKFWEAWANKNKRMPFVQNGLVFAVGDTDSARDQATDFAEKKNGMERLDPVKDVQRITDGKAEGDLNHLRQGIADAGRRAQMG